jgi:hypothetical protein
MWLSVIALPAVVLGGATGFTAVVVVAAAYRFCSGSGGFGTEAEIELVSPRVRSVK